MHLFHCTKGCDDVGIKFENVSKSFDTTKVLENFNLEIVDGDTVAIMGESGSGKTTFLNIISGLIKADTGNVSGVSGKRIAFVFQEDRLAENFTVYRNICLGAGLNLDRRRVVEALAEIGLEKKIINEKVLNLSGGMKRRVSILRALFYDYDILLLDEPTKGLDEQNKKLTVDYILKNSQNKTVVWVTHDENEAKYVSERVITIE